MEPLSLATPVESIALTPSESEIWSDSQTPRRRSSRTDKPKGNILNNAIKRLPRPLGRVAQNVLDGQRRIIGSAIVALPGPLGQQLRERTGEGVEVVEHLGDLDLDDGEIPPLRLTVNVPSLKKTVTYQRVASHLAVSDVLGDTCLRLSVDVPTEPDMLWAVFMGHRMPSDISLAMVSLKLSTENLRCVLVFSPAVMSRLSQIGPTTVYWNLRGGGGRAPIRINLQFSIGALKSVLRDDDKFQKALKEKSLYRDDIVDLDLRLSLDGVVLMSDATLDTAGIRKNSVISVEILQKSPFTINIRMPDGAALTRDVLYRDTVDVLKEVISRDWGIPSQKQRLWKEDIKTGHVRLSDECTLSDCDINPLSTVAVEYIVDHHILPTTASLSGENWRKLLPELPAQLRHDIEYNEKFHSWTFTPFTTLSADSVPLKIAGAPVVIPVESRFPLLEGMSPPEDPWPKAIDPCAPIGLSLIQKVVRQFDNVLGFYILINGMLQIQVPKDFDIAAAMSKQPAKFGGLTVSYIRQSMDPTAFKIFGMKIDPKPVPATQPPRIKHNDRIGVRATQGKSRNGMTGRVGLLLAEENKHYLTIPTHLITHELHASRTSRRLPWTRNTNTPYLSENWKDDVEPSSGGEKIGQFVKSFDPEARDYPSGFHHDVTLFEPVDRSVISSFSNPIENLGWLSESAWNGLRSGSEPIHILEELDPPEASRRTRVLPNVEESDCQIIGAGIRINYESFETNIKTVDIDVLQKAVSECLLYRVSPNFPPEGGCSGVVVWAHGKREDDTTGRGVVGFQSFEQRSNFSQPSINTNITTVQQRLEDGRIAFYGAFKVPPEMKRNYEIV